MDRRTFIGRVAGGLLALPLPAQAQQAGRVYHLGILSLGMRSASDKSLATWLATHLRGLATSRAGTSTWRQIE